MARVMALDIGERRIGVAVSDESGLFAFPEKTLARQEGYRRDMAAIRDLVQEREVSAVVVGLPLNMNGTRGPMAQAAEEFAATLRRYTTVPVVLQDERLSTAEAERRMVEADRSRKERRRAVDSVAAGIILQTYLDRQRSQSHP